MDNKIDIDSLVKIEQMPKVFEQLEIIGKFVDEKLENINNLECSEENKVEVKKIRAGINSTIDILESKRKEIKSKLLEPYEIFEEKYKKEAYQKLKNASQLLGEKISEIETNQKKLKEVELKRFFDQHSKSLEIDDIITFENVGLNITLSASEKSLKEQIVSYCERIKNDITLIKTLSDAPDLLYEYTNNGFDLNNAIASVKKRKEATKQAEEVIDDEPLEEVKEIIEEIIAPVEIEEEITLSFTVTSTKTKLIKLREFMKENEIKYE